MEDINLTKVLYMVKNKSSAAKFISKLEQEGYDVEIAVDGEKGLENCLKNKYDVVCIENDLPKISGLEVITKLNELNKSLPSIMLINSGNEKIAAEAIKMGATDYLVKDSDSGYLELLPTVIEHSLIKSFMKEKEFQAERELYDSEERFRKLSEASFEGIVIHKDGNILVSNNTFADMYGYDSSEVIGRNILDFISKDNHEAAQQNIFSDSRTEGEILGIKNNGSSFYVDISSRSIPYKGIEARELHR